MVGVRSCRQARAGCHRTLAICLRRHLIVGCLKKLTHKNNNINSKREADRDECWREGLAGGGCASGISVTRALLGWKWCDQAHGDHLRVRKSIRAAWHSNKQRRQSLNCRVSRQASKFSGFLPGIDVQPCEDRNRVERRWAPVIRNGCEQESIMGQPKAGRYRRVRHFN